MTTTHFANVANELWVPGDIAWGTPEPSGTWPENEAALVAGYGSALVPWDGPGSITNQTIDLSGRTRSSMFADEPGGANVHLQWCYISMTEGSSFRPKGYTPSIWLVEDTIIEGDSETVVSPVHGDILHCLMGAGDITFKRCLLQWLNSESTNVQLTGMINLESWTGTVTFEDSCLHHDGFGGFYPIRHGFGADLLFTRCQMPEGWDSRYPDGTQGTMTLVDCVDHNGDPIPDQTWVHLTRTFA